MSEQEKKRKKSGRAARIESYVPTAGGGYRYIGKHYLFPEGQRLTYKRYMQMRLMLSILSGLAVIGSGLINSPGMHNTFYVIIPFAGSFILTVAVLWSLCRAMYHGVPLKEYVYDATIVRLKALTVVQGVCAVLTAAGETVFLILSAEKQPLLSLLFAALQLLAAAAALAHRFISDKFIWEKTEK